jgi:putative nucleotidyltransferase with HDIG domain
MRRHSEELWLKFLIDLSQYIDSRITLTNHHSRRVALWSRATARKLAISEKDVQTVYWAALLHDIGKVGIPEDVLTKAGPLTDEEWILMKLHPTVGANIVRRMKTFSHIAPVIHCHQERFDGSGYPYGLLGEQIPFGARILTVVDAYEAMTTDRVYRRARSHPEAVAELREMGGSQFDPAVVEAFLQVLHPPVSYQSLPC